MNIQYKMPPDTADLSGTLVLENPLLLPRRGPGGIMGII
jgi:hypothetical protein